MYWLYNLFKHKLYILQCTCILLQELDGNDSDTPEDQMDADQIVEYLSQSLNERSPDSSNLSSNTSLPARLTYDDVLKTADNVNTAGGDAGGEETPTDTHTSKVCDVK